MERATPIVIDPEITRVMRSGGPSIEDIENHEPRRKTVSLDRYDGIDTLGDLIDVLETIRDKFGEDVTVESSEAGFNINVNARKYDNGDTVVDL